MFSGIENDLLSLYFEYALPPAPRIIGSSLPLFWSIYEDLKFLTDILCPNLQSSSTQETKPYSKYSPLHICQSFPPRNKLRDSRGRTVKRRKVLESWGVSRFSDVFLLGFILPVLEISTQYPYFVLQNILMEIDPLASANEIIEVLSTSEAISLSVPKVPILMFLLFRMWSEYS